jgi:hypothetical protein
MNNHSTSSSILLAGKSAFSLLVVTVLLSAPACKTTSGVTGKPLKEKTPEAVMESLVRNQVNAEWFSARMDVSYADQNQSVGASATIRMRKDSIIWMNVKKLGFELARLLITQDSVFVMDRINNQFIAEDLHFLEKAYNIPANLFTLQALILGNPVFFSIKNLNVENRELSYHLFGKDDKMENHYWLDPARMLLQKMQFNDFRSNRKVDVNLDGYEKGSDNQFFSYIRKLEFNSQETGAMSIGLKFSKVEINIPKSISFEIPQRYTRIN